MTGTSVVALKYKDGIMMAADTLGIASLLLRSSFGLSNNINSLILLFLFTGSYGTLARFFNVERIKVFGSVLVGGSGDLSDLQYVFDELSSLRTREFTHDDGHELNAKEIWAYLTRMLYARRSDGDPIYVQLIVADLAKGSAPFLAQVDLHGTCFEDDTLATGFGAHLARPLLRNAVDSAGWQAVSREEARKVLENCMRVLFYRDCKTINRIQFADVTAEGLKLEKPVELSTNWEVGNRPMDAQGSW